VIRRLYSTCPSASVQTARSKRGIIPPLHECPPTGGSHGKLHPTPKILSRTRRRGGRLAARGARAAIGKDPRRYQEHPIRHQSTPHLTNACANSDILRAKISSWIF